jgi:ABC-type glycerol-3-phosphate transport system substrate-binding protein
MKKIVRTISVAFLLIFVMGLFSLGIPAAAQSTVIRYANWNVGPEEENNVQRQLVAVYEEAHPGVDVQFVDMSGDGNWEEILTTLAARGELPDVFMANNTPYYVQNGWLADLTDRVAADPEWANVPQTLVDAVTYNGRVLGLPSEQSVMGYYVNLDLFEAANLEPPVYGMPVDEFFATVTALTDIRRNILGTNEVVPIMGWYPHTVDANLGWFSFDGRHMNYNSEAFRAAVEMAISMVPHSWQGLSEEQRASFASIGPWELFMNQEAGAIWDGGWVAPYFAENATFNWDFLGIPGGGQAVVADIIVVSATAPDLEAAFDFARWMSYSAQGYQTEAELSRASGVVPTRMPVVPDAESIDLYMSFMGDRPGLRTALENIDNSIIESLAKIVPGYINARWEGHPGIDIGENLNVTMSYIFDNVWTGAFKFEDYAAQLEAYANNIMDEARAALER